MPAGKPARARLALALLLLAGGVLLLFAGRHLTFFFDEWTFITRRRGSGLDAYLSPHNGHLVLFSALVYKVLFAVVGLRHYFAYQFVTVVLHLLCCALLYLLIRRRLEPWHALALVALLLLLGTAWQLLLWPFQMAYLGSVAGGLVALAALERGGGRREPIAAAGLTWSVISSGVGLAFLAATAVFLLVRGDPWRRTWVVAVPAVLFGLWYLGYGGGETVTSESLLSSPQYVASAAAGATAGIAGLDGTWGPPLVLVLVGLIGWSVRLRGHATPMLLATITGALVFWLLAAITRADSPEPAASRYLYIGAVFILVAASEVRLGATLRGWWLVLGGVLLSGALVSNLHALRGGERGLRAVDDSVRASMAAVDVAAPTVSPAFLVYPPGVPQLTAGAYLSASHDLGSPALTLFELEHAPERLRLGADETIQHAEQLAVVPGPAPSRTGCRQLPSGGGPQFPVSPGAVLRLSTAPRSPFSVSARRFADEFGMTPLGQLAGGSARIVFPRDRAAGLSWRVRIAASGTVTVCTQPAG